MWDYGNLWHFFVINFECFCFLVKFCSTLWGVNCGQLWYFGTLSGVNCRQFWYFGTPSDINCRKFWYFSTFSGVNCRLFCIFNTREKNKPMTSGISSRHSINCATNLLEHSQIKRESKLNSGDVRHDMWRETCDRRCGTRDVIQECCTDIVIDYGIYDTFFVPNVERLLLNL